MGNLAQYNTFWSKNIILGVSCSGKSFDGKQEISFISLKKTNSDIIILDPERVHSTLVKSLGGKVIKISAISNNHINAMEKQKH